MSRPLRAIVLNPRYRFIRQPSRRMLKKFCADMTSDEIRNFFQPLNDTRSGHEQPARHQTRAPGKLEQERQPTTRRWHVIANRGGSREAPQRLKI